MYNESEILKDLKQKRKSLEAELTRVNKAIFALEPVPIQYMEWKRKAIECLNGFHSYSQTLDILSCVFNDTPDILEDEILRKRYVTGLSVALDDLCKTGVIKKFKLYRIKGNFYGFPHWFNEDGTLQKDFYNWLMLSMEQDVNHLLMNKEAA